MQPPTEPNHHTPGGTSGRPRGDEADLYRRHHRRLLQAVSHAVNAPPDVIEDACQTAWAALLRCTVERATVFAWLRIVAIHEAWKHAARTRTETPAGAFLTACAGELELGEHPEPAADTRDVSDQVAARIHHAQRLADLATIKPHELQALYLKGLGYRYREIMRLSRGVCVKSAVLAGSDIDDMSSIESVPPFVRGGRTGSGLLLLRQCGSERAALTPRVVPTWKSGTSYTSKKDESARTSAAAGWAQTPAMQTRAAFVRRHRLCVA
jgi:DNA-directed RNA polymerase specialized sigma24 family protein